MNNYLIPNLAKACHILTWLAGQQKSHSVTEIARHFEIPRTTAFRILRTFTAEGWLNEVEGKYSTGVGLLQLGLLALRTIEIHSLAEPILQNLARSTGETAHLAMPQGDHMIIMQVAESPNPIRVASQPGSVVNIHCSSTGKAVLATLEPDAVRALLKGKQFEQHTDRTITSIDALEQELEQVRRQGYAVDDEEYHEGVRCLAAAVFDARGIAVAGLGITAATQRFTKKKIPTVASQVIEAAHLLSDAMGRQSTTRDT